MSEVVGGLLLFVALALALSVRFRNKHPVPETVPTVAADERVVLRVTAHHHPRWAWGLLWAEPVMKAMEKTYQVVVTTEQVVVFERPFVGRNSAVVAEGPVASFAVDHVHGGRWLGTSHAHLHCPGAKTMRLAMKRHAAQSLQQQLAAT